MKLSGIRGIVRFLLHQLDFCHARVYDIVHWSKSHCTCTCILHRVQMAIHICATMVYCHANCYSLISAWNHLVYVYLSLEEWELFSCIRSLCQWLHPWDWTPPPFLKLGFPCGTLCTFLSEIEFEANVNENLYFLEWQRYTWLIEHQHNMCTTWTTLDCLFTWLFRILSIIVRLSHISLDQYIPVHV